MIWKRAAKPAEEDFGSTAGLAGLRKLCDFIWQISFSHNKKHSQALVSLKYPLSIWNLLGP